MLHQRSPIVVTGNSFLDSLSVESRSRLFPLLEREHVLKSQVLAQPGLPAQRLFFPVSCVISTVTHMSDGAGVEVALAGHDGMSPISLAFANRVGAQSTIVQVPDSAYSLPAEAFLDRMRADSALRERVFSYAHYSFVAASQFVACNRLHPVESRYARWILMADDRVGSREFTLTQELTAQMLGVRRASVTVIARTMSTSGLIRYRRGHLVVGDRAGLERSACECYGVINAELRKLMGYGARRSPLGTVASSGNDEAGREAS